MSLNFGSEALAAIPVHDIGISESVRPRSKIVGDSGTKSLPPILAICQLAQAKRLHSERSWHDAQPMQASARYIGMVGPDWDNFQPPNAIWKEHVVMG